MSNLPPRYEGPVIQDFLLTLDAAQQKLGDVLRMPFGKNDLIMVCDPDLAYDVLVRQNRRFVKLGADGQTPGLQRILGAGLLTNPEYGSWFSHRQLIQPFFQRSALERFFASMVGASERLGSSWQEGERVNLTEVMHRVTLELIYELVFSLAPKDANAYPIQVPLSLASAKTSVVRRAAAHLDESIYALLEKRKKDRLQGRRFEDLLGLLLDAEDGQGEKMTDKDLRDELLTVFAAGHETTANTLIWAFIGLMSNSEAKERLEHELRRCSEPLSLESLKGLPYLSAVVRETLRLYPTIPFAPRVSLEDTQLGDFFIPKGSRLFVSIYSIHRHGHFWEDPLAFKPERFIIKGAQKAYMPFGLGERVCLGQHLAMLETQVILAVLLRRWSFELEQTEFLPKVAISLQPKTEVWASLNSQS
ncbi:MAG: cytochrome P450 [Trueperaceae bacterium]|nr:cytochrome P450 [Trueperaceae bacterium]